MSDRAGGGRLRLKQEGLHWREVDGEVVVLREDDQMYIGINATGGALWHRLVEGATRDQLADHLVTRFYVDREEAVRDVDDFLAAAGAEGLLEQ